MRTVVAWTDTVPEHEGKKQVVWDLAYKPGEWRRPPCANGASAQWPVCASWGGLSPSLTAPLASPVRVPDGTQLVVAVGRRLVVYNANTGEVMRQKVGACLHGGVWPRALPQPRACPARS